MDIFYNFLIKLYNHNSYNIPIKFNIEFSMHFKALTIYFLL